MTSFGLAWQFLTIFPWKMGGQDMKPSLLGKSMAFYPLVGLLLGLMLAGAFWLLARIFPKPLADGLIILLLALFTGALHLDGLADSLDGLALGKAPEERLRIMKDHRVGTFGAVGLILVLGIKYLAIDSLAEDFLFRGLPVALVQSRWSMVQLTYRMPYARKEGGLGLVFKENLQRSDWFVATLMTLVFSFICLSFRGILIFLGIAAFTWGIQFFFQRRIGGFTGDILGAANELNETLVLLLLAGMVFLRF